MLSQEEWQTRPLSGLSRSKSTPYADSLVCRIEKYKPLMVAQSGVDPLGSFASFMKKDPIKNIDVRRDDRPRVDVK